MADLSVRPAQAEDSAALAGVQVAAWRSGYGEVLPAHALDGLSASQEAFAQQWLAAITAPPSPVYRVVVACAGPVVVGAISTGPASDEDVNPAVTAEIFTLVVHPDHRREGHGSRLLAAAVDLMRLGGFVTASHWVDEADAATVSLLRSAGWAPDGSLRTLDLDGDGSVVIAQLRMHTDLSRQ